MSDETVVTESIEAPIVEQVVTTENAEPNIESVETKPEKTFTQTELDGIITKRIERERETTAKKVSQESRDAYVAEQGYTFNGQPITTEAELKHARKEIEQQEFAEKLKEQELPQEEQDRILADRKFRQENEPILTNLQAKAKQENDFKAFFGEYPTLDPKDIPQSVWVDYAAGKDLIETYAKHENASLKQRLADLEKQKQVEQQNKENAEAATGSVVGQGTAIVANFTREQVAAMSKEEMKVNYPAVVASMKAWKK